MSRHKHHKSTNIPPFPGEAGRRVMALMSAGDMKAATRLFQDAFIGELGPTATIAVLEDDGDCLIFRSSQGLFKVRGIGRRMVLEVQAIETESIASLRQAFQTEPARQAVRQIVENQISQNEPPEVQQTYHRLLAAGYSHESAIDQLVTAVDEVFGLALSARQPYNAEHYISLLKKLG